MKRGRDAGVGVCTADTRKKLFWPNVARLQHMAALLKGAPPTVSLMDLLASLLGTELSESESLITACNRFIAQKRGTVWPISNDKACNPFVFVQFLAAIVREALLFPERFNKDEAGAAESLALDPSAVCWSKHQTLSILCCAFLCVFDDRPSDNCRTAEQEQHPQLQLPSINYDEMFFARQKSPETEKLLMFLDYLYYMLWSTGANGTASPPAGDGRLHILRHRSPSLEALLADRGDDVLCPVVIHRLGSSIDDASTMMRVDFANEIIGGASIAYGCVQEEITFSLCPELNTARLIHSAMRADEAIVMCGADQYSTLKPGTYAFSMQHNGPPTTTLGGDSAAGAGGGVQHRGGAVLAIDAMDYRYVDQMVQYEWNTMQRELCKCLAAFCAPVLSCGVPPAEADCVATGNWGCGVFGGDVALKFLLQWVACSMAQKRAMHYFPFDQQRVAEVMGPLCSTMCAQRVTVRALVEFLQSVVPAAATAQPSDERRARRTFDVWALLRNHVSAYQHTSDAAPRATEAASAA